MFDYLYDWIWNLTVYMVLVTAVLQAVPGNDYKKYIRFFTGLVLVLMIAAPVLRLFGTEWDIQRIYHSGEYQKRLDEIENSTAYLTDVRVEDYLIPDQKEKAGEEDGIGGIKVEEIHIGYEKQDFKDK